MDRTEVLVVDDDPALRSLLGRLARGLGFAVREAADGVEALGLIRARHPDIVVTDVHMPRMQGPRLIELLRKIPGMQDKPVIVLTADAARSTKIRLLEHGADDFILKPVDPDDFRARLRAQARRSDLAVTLELVREQRDVALDQLQKRSEELERLSFGLIAALERANSLNDEDTGNHLRRVSELARMLAAARGCPPLFVEQVHRYASLHDVGKVGIPDAILKKPGKLTPRSSRRCTTPHRRGAARRRAAGGRHQHPAVPPREDERSGLPAGAGASRSPEARIVAVDVYDALRSKRCYKPAFDADKAESILREIAATTSILCSSTSSSPDPTRSPHLPDLGGRPGSRGGGLGMSAPIVGSRVGRWTLEALGTGSFGSAWRRWTTSRVAASRSSAVRRGRGPRCPRRCPR